MHFRHGLFGDFTAGSSALFQDIHDVIGIFLEGKGLFADGVQFVADIFKEHLLAVDTTDIRRSATVSDGEKRIVFGECPVDRVDVADFRITGVFTAHAVHICDGGPQFFPDSAFFFHNADIVVQCLSTFSTLRQHREFSAPSRGLAAVREKYRQNGC